MVRPPTARAYAQDESPTRELVEAGGHLREEGRVPICVGESTSGMAMSRSVVALRALRAVHGSRGGGRAENFEQRSPVLAKAFSLLPNGLELGERHARLVDTNS